MHNIKSITLVFYCLCFVLPPITSYAEELQMPKDYLGWWPPYSRITNGYGIKFSPNGLAYYQHEENKDYQAIVNYKVLDISNKSTYLLVYITHELPEPWTSTEIWEISQRDERSLQFLNIKAYNCKLTLKDFIAYSEKPAIISLPTQCQNYKNISYSSFMAYARDR